jgi:carbonic anhydrase
MKTQTKETQDSLSPNDAHNILIEGNNRFVKNSQINRDLQNQVLETSKGQFPFAVVLSCIDSRVPAELVFDQGIGDVFSIRVAGNIINEDVLGSMEYSCKVAGSKVLVVMGHSKCGAVTAACNDVELGNISALLRKIKPAVNTVRDGDKEMSNSSIEKVAVENVKLSIERIRKESSILSEMETNQEIEILGAMYSVTSGKVEFFES